MWGYTGCGTTWADEMNFGINHAPGAGWIAWPVDLQSNTVLRLPYIWKNWLFWWTGLLLHVFDSIVSPKTRLHLLKNLLSPFYVYLLHLFLRFNALNTRAFTNKWSLTIGGIEWNHPFNCWLNFEPCMKMNCSGPETIFLSSVPVQPFNSLPFNFRLLFTGGGEKKYSA